MTIVQTLELADEAAPADPCVERGERHARLLAELAEIGMDLARIVRRRALARDVAEVGAAEVGGGDIGLVYARIAKAVRLTLALETRLAEDRLASVARRAAEEVARQEADDLANGFPAVRGYIRKLEVLDAVEQTLDIETSDEDRIERLLDETREQLSEYEDVDVATRPVSEIIAIICKDLGLTPDWSLWTDQDWAVREAEERQPGSPYGRAGADENLLPAGEGGAHRASDGRMRDYGPAERSG